MTRTPLDRRPSRLIECPPPGIHENIPAKIYHSWDAMNQSTLKDFDVSAAYGVEKYENRSNPTKDHLFGDGFHACALEPERFKRDSVDSGIADGAVWKTHCKAVDRARAEDDIEEPIILRDGWRKRMDGMLEEISNNEYAGWILDDFDRREISLVWDETVVVAEVEYRVPCKARIDLFVNALPDPINAPCGLDLKTTKEASYEGFCKALGDFKYHMQAAWYLRGMVNHGLIGELHQRAWMILAVEKVAPYHNALYTINLDSIMQGAYQCNEAAKLFVDYRVNGNAPGLPGVPRDIALPSWHQLPKQMTHNSDIIGAIK